MDLKPTNWRYLSAFMLVGDGVLAMIRPSRGALAWQMGPQSWRGPMAYLARHPGLTRVLGAGEVATGVALIMTGGRRADTVSELAAAVQNAAKHVA